MWLCNQIVHQANSSVQMDSASQLLWNVMATPIVLIQVMNLIAVRVYNIFFKNLKFYDLFYSLYKSHFEPLSIANYFLASQIHPMAFWQMNNELVVRHS